MDQLRRTSVSMILAIAALVAVTAHPVVEAADAGESAGPAEASLYVVLFFEAPLATYPGGLPGLSAIRPGRGEGRLDPNSPASRAYLAWLRGRQDQHHAEMTRELGRSPEVVFRYRAGGNGMAIRLSAAEAEIVRRLPGVDRVVLDYVMPLDTDRTVELIGAHGIWDGSDSNGVATQGEGAVVGIIDTGINMGHPSYADDPVDGHVFTNPLGAGNHVGWCDPGNPNFDPQFVCNEKLIGAWDFADAVSTDNNGPEDDDGHGSHTSSTAAGNLLDLDGDGVGDMSGVAPHANVIAYDACFVDLGSGLGLCPFSATSASVDRAILDGVVDAINYSISGGTSPWGGDIDTFFLNAVAAGIFVSASAGNSGPGAGTTAHLGPWMTTVGASTHDRVINENALVSMSGGISPPADITGVSRSGGHGPAPIVHAKNFSNGDADPGQCLSEFPPATWTGEIVVCDRGDIPRVMKGQNVLKGGAGGFVLANVSGGSTGTVDDAHVLPATHVGLADADLLRAWLDGGGGHTATLAGAVLILDPPAADNMASFSSRGPNPAMDVIKPDVTNMGASVFAASADGILDDIVPFEGPEFAVLSGTSMSSPHTAGCAALLKSLHPDWTPSEIKSALMTTADTNHLKENGVTPADPFDMGGGRVDLSQAGRAGLILDETQANYLAANPSQGGDPKTLNLASFADSDCPGCTWTRTLESSAAGAVQWTVTGNGPSWMGFQFTPSVFTIAPGATQVLTVQVFPDVTAPLGVWGFGEVVLTPDDVTVPEAKMPVAVIPAALPVLVFESSTVDDSAGNANGVLDPSELVNLEVELRDTSVAAASNVAGTLSTGTPGVTIIDAEATWLAIFGLDVRTSNTPHFQFHVDGTVACDAIIDFTLDLSTNEGPFTLNFSQMVGANLPATVSPGSVDTPLAIPDNSVQGIDSSIVLSEAFTVASVSVSLDITHTDVGDLEVELTSPGGTMVRFHDRTGVGTQDLVTTYPVPTFPDGPGAMGDFNGEASSGTWTLNVADRSNNNAGTINSWSMELVGVPVLTCTPVPCLVVADAAAIPGTVCEGGSVTLDASLSAEYGSDCSGTLEYRFEIGGSMIQDWSVDPDVVVIPPASTAYTTLVRDQGTLAQDLVFPPVTVLPVPSPSIVQNPDPICVEDNAVQLDAGAGFSSYTWRDDGDQVVGTSQLLDLDASACGRTYTVEVDGGNGCTESVPHEVSCMICDPGEVSAPGSAVPFLFGIDAAGTLEFQLLPDPGVVYHLYGATTVADILAGDWTHKYCNLESSAIGTWNTVDATTVRWTPLIPAIMFAGHWVVIAESFGIEGSYGSGIGGPRSKDADGMGSSTNVCP